MENDGTDALMADIDSLMNEFESAVAAGSSADGCFSVGASVEARYRGGDRWYKGRIDYCNRDGTFNIKYLDGEKETNILPSNVRLWDQPEPTKQSQPTASKLEVQSLKATSSFGDTIMSPKKSDSPSRVVPTQSEVSPTNHLKESPREDEINVMSEEELRQLSRNPTEDRNLIHISTSGEGRLDSRDAAISKTRLYGSEAKATTLASTFKIPLENPLDDFDEILMSGGFDGDIDIEEEDKYPVEYERDGTVEQSGVNTARSSDYHPDGTLKRKPYRGALSKPVIKAGNTVISAAQARLFGLTDFKGGVKEVDPDVNAKNTLRRIHNLTKIVSKDLSYIQSEDDIESTFKPKRSAKAESAMRNPACGYDFVDRLEKEENGFLERAESGSKSGGKNNKVLKDQAEMDYEASHDKLGCPQCKRLQSFDEFWEKKRMCQVCNVRYVKVNVSSGAALLRRMKVAEEKRQENLKKASEEMYGYKPFKPSRLKDHYSDLKADMQQLFLTIFEPRQDEVVYLRDQDLPLTTIAKVMRDSPHFLVLSKKSQQEMTTAALSGFLEMDALFSRYVRFDSVSKKKVLSGWRESPDFSSPEVFALRGEESEKLKQERLYRAQNLEKESKLKADKENNSAIKPAHRLELLSNTNKNDFNAKKYEESVKESRDQVYLLKQLAKLNAEKANLLNATLQAAEMRAKDHKDFVDATKTPKSVGNGAISRDGSVSASRAGKDSKKSPELAESEAKTKASKEKATKQSAAGKLSAPVDKFDALINF